ncbi:hypothetical protein [Rhodococcus koreensis]
MDQVEDDQGVLAAGERDVAIVLCEVGLDQGQDVGDGVRAGLRKRSSEAAVHRQVRAGVRCIHHSWQVTVPSMTIAALIDVAWATRTAAVGTPEVAGAPDSPVAGCV